MSELVLSVAQINTYIKNIFDAEEMLIGVKVVGEITNLKQSGRAYYFDLKDDEASLPCVVFDNFIMENFKFGDKVSAKGKLNYYVKGGRLTFVVSKLEKYGIGDLYKEYLELKTKLEKQGIFDESIKKPLPKYPKRVGVVTSETGAVIRDIIRVARSKNRSTDILLCPAKVQGVGAKESIIKGIKILEETDVDVIIVARGGGSFEDYQPFNSEEVVMAVYNAKKPIISAIGHENDWSLIDFAADRRASTPSVASEIAFYSDQELMDKITSGLNNAIALLNNYIKQVGIKLKTPISQMSQVVNYKIDKNLNRTISIAGKMVPLVQNKVDKAKSKIDLLSLSVEKSNPMALLRNGFSKLTKENKVVASVDDVNVGDEVKTELIGGVICSKIIKKEKNNGL